MPKKPPPCQSAGEKVRWIFEGSRRDRALREEQDRKKYEEFATPGVIADFERQKALFAEVFDDVDERKRVKAAQELSTQELRKGVWDTREEFQKSPSSLTDESASDTNVLSKYDPPTSDSQETSEDFQDAKEYLQEFYDAREFQDDEEFDLGDDQEEEGASFPPPFTEAEKRYLNHMRQLQPREPKKKTR